MVNQYTDKERLDYLLEFIHWLVGGSEAKTWTREIIDSHLQKLERIKEEPPRTV